jgi:hypothetical protein
VTRRLVSSTRELEPGWGGGQSGAWKPLDKPKRASGLMFRLLAPLLHTPLQYSPSDKKPSKKLAIHFGT